jgi:hypothetical protein
VPIVLFLVLVTCVLALFALGQPRETFIGAGVAALGIPAAALLVPNHSRRQNVRDPPEG